MSSLALDRNRSWQEWKMEKDQIETLRYRLIAYTGNFDASEVEDAYKAFAVGEVSESFKSTQLYDLPR